MIVVMAASGDADGVRSPKQVWCFSAADARQASAALIAQYREEDAMEVFSVDFPEVNSSALRRAAWRKTAEDCTRIALAMYLKHKQPVGEPREAWDRTRDGRLLQRAA